ncbi:MAG: hypothetical protein ABW047_04240 [Nitrospiraceae bacterium]
MTGPLKRPVRFTSRHRIILITVFLSRALYSVAWGEPLPPVDAVMPPVESAAPEQAIQEQPALEQVVPEQVAPEQAAPETMPASPSIRVSGTVWRSKPGIVFLQTPIGTLSLSSKTCLRDIKGSHAITLSVNGPSTAVDIRDRGTGSLVHRYLTSIPHYASAEKRDVRFWTPEGDKTFSVGSFASKIAAAKQAVTVEVDEAGTIKGVHDLQFDLQVNQAPKNSSHTHVRLSGTVSKLKSAYVFLKTPLGMVTVSSKTGVRNAKVGQDMTVWVHEDSVAIDLFQADATVPLHRFLTGRLVYTTPEQTAMILWTPEGDKTFPTDHRGKGALSSLKEGSRITVELDRQGTIVDIRHLN